MLVALVLIDYPHLLGLKPLLQVTPRFSRFAHEVPSAFARFAKRGHSGEVGMGKIHFMGGEHGGA
ncbi:hypothetical protein CPA45_05520 [Vreelandella nigrificans]|uniref:Uncharacterized protein n=1 Tax=Vreelandella nigrificans TaxID=2042704 RepID=A0A2A4HNJ5_9GAMM|nr:hypothetical protein CPA45_05520 [Halomonas nigrificans]